ncbi:hypothetical protein ACEPAH_1248 [Sanghuangporus vaninii]
MDITPSTAARTDRDNDVVQTKENSPDSVMQGKSEAACDAEQREAVRDDDDKEEPTSEEPIKLTVTDALNYIDAIKARFAQKRPDMYNNFLNIMKDFKCHVIDTAGVVDWISSLFEGHNDLIQGFNKFLPPTYCILCASDAIDASTTSARTSLDSGRNEQIRRRRGALVAQSNSHNSARFVNNVRARL